jgi:hypothetical protein
LATSLKASVLWYHAQRLHMHCTASSSSLPSSAIINYNQSDLAFCDCACVLSESTYVHVYGDRPFNGYEWSGHGQSHIFNGYALLLSSCMQRHWIDQFLPQGWSYYHGR